MLDRKEVICKTYLIRSFNAALFDKKRVKDKIVDVLSNSLGGESTLNRPRGKIVKKKKGRLKFLVKYEKNLHGVDRTSRFCKAGRELGTLWEIRDSLGLLSLKC